jgi:hypothetical protein
MTPREPGPPNASELAPGFFNRKTGNYENMKEERETFGDRRPIFSLFSCLHDFIFSYQIRMTEP